MDYNPAGSSVMEYSSQEYWSVLPCPPPVDLPDPRMEPVSVKFPELAGGFFTTSAFWEARRVIIRMSERVEREVGGGIGMGKTCKLKDVSFQCMTKFTTN